MRTNFALHRSIQPTQITRSLATGASVRPGTLRPLTPLNLEVVNDARDMLTNASLRSRGAVGAAFEILARRWDGELKNHVEELLQACRGEPKGGAKAFNHFFAANLKSTLAWGAATLNGYEDDPHMGGAPRMTEHRVQGFLAESGAVHEEIAKYDKDLALAHASVIPPSLREAFGIKLSPAEVREVDALSRAAGGRFLSQTQILVLRDYVHSDTGTFNLFRALAAMKNHLPDEPFSVCMADLSREFDAAVDVLAASPSFVLEVDLYKGLTLEPFLEHWLSHAVTQGAPYVNDRPLSTTTDPLQSYAGRNSNDQHYDHELIFKGGRAVNAACFHSQETWMQKEALLLPGQAYRLEDAGSQDRFTGESLSCFRRYVARPEGG